MVKDINNIKIYTAADALNYKRPVHVRIEGDEIGFPEHKYWIALSRIKTHAALLEWIHHLCGKAWMTTEMVEQLIEQVYAYHGWELYKGEKGG